MSIPSTCTESAGNGPSPYMYLLQVPNSDGAVDFSIDPEALVTVHEGWATTSRPVAEGQTTRTCFWKKSCGGRQRNVPSI